MGVSERAGATRQRVSSLRGKRVKPKTDRAKQGMPQAKILTKQALYTLSQLHSESAGKLSANLRETGNRSRRRPAREMAIEKGRQLRRPYLSNLWGAKSASQAAKISIAAAAAPPMRMRMMVSG